MTLYVGSNKIKDISTHGVYVGSQNTNVITSVPKNINLTLSNGTLTLKAGSKVYVPNGPGRFDSIITTSDMRITNPMANATQFILYGKNNGTGLGVIETYYTESGQSSTLTTKWRVWYDTVNNIIKRTDDTGTTWSTGYSFPIALITHNGSQWTSIDQIFDWCGFIGSTAFVLPGVKGLIPNGFKTDGTYNVIEYTTDRVSSYEQAGTYSNFDVLLTIENKLTGYYVNLDTQNNVLKGQGGQIYKDRFVIGKSSCESGKITSLTPAIVQPSTTTIPINAIYNGSQLVYKYRPYADGTVILYGSNTGLKTYTLEKGLYQCCVVAGGFRSGYWSSSSGSAVEIQFRLTETSTVQVYSGGTESTAYLNINGTRMITAYGNGGQTGAPTVSEINTSVYWVKTVVNNRGLGGGGHKGSVSPYGGWGAGQNAGGARLAYVGV